MASRKTVAFLIPVLKGGGAERIVTNLVAHLDRSQYDVFVITGKLGPAAKKTLPADVEPINLRFSTLPMLLVKLVGCLRKHRFDILNAPYPHVGTVAIMAKLLAGVQTKVVLAQHTAFSQIPATARTFYKKFGARYVMPHFMRAFYPHAHAIVCVSQGVKDDLTAVVGDLPSIRVIYNPVVGPHVYAGATEPLESADAPLFADGVPVILAAGRLVPAKDYPTLLKAFAAVTETMDARLVILGVGPLEEALRHNANQLHVAEKVHFLGFKPNPYAYMAKASVFVLSSVREGFGNVIAEAMACGAPVVATDCNSGPGEIIQNGENGLLVPPGNPRALADALLRVLRDPALAGHLANAGKMRAPDFSVEKGITRYEELFASLV